MLVFFRATENIETITFHDNIQYKHEFKGSVGEKINTDSIYITTPHDYREHAKYASQILNKPHALELLKVKDIEESKLLPLNLGFQDSLDKAYQPLVGKQELNIAILNGMSNAFGDHLVGLTALNILKEKLSQKFNQVNIKLLQLNPLKLHPLNNQTFCGRAYVLPLKMNLLSGMFDGFYDFGGLTAMKGFNELPMIDFFLQGLSIDPASIPVTQKRNSFIIDFDSRLVANLLMKHIKNKAGNRQILMFHPKASSIIRSMDEASFKSITKQIIEKSDYFIISTLPTTFKHERFMNLHKFSRHITDFAAILSMCDKLLTVDTMSYHFADAVNTPAVALFTSIEPDLRCRYYPDVKGVFVGDKKLPFYGHHKFDLKKDGSKQDLQKIKKMIKKIWSNLSIDTILSELNK